LLTVTEFREIVSGTRRGCRAELWRAFFSLLACGYALAVRWRNHRYDRRRATIHRVGVPVVSVGNLTAGGTGKTPMVAWLARWFRQRGVRVTLVSRGYGAAAGALNDEALELEQQLPDVPHLQNPDRVAAALTAIEEFGCQLVLLDDAFQHRRIDRDLDLVLIDALEPFGFGRLLPRGLLREPLASLQRAQVIALTRSDLVTADERSRIWNVIRHSAPNAECLETVHRPQFLASWPAARRELSSLASQPVAAFCGIGNPEGFRRTLGACGYRLAGFRTFSDHHPYGREDLEALSAWSERLEATSLLCTFKDLVKIQVPQLGQTPLFALCIGLELLAGQDVLEDQLQRVLDKMNPNVAETGKE